MWKTRKGKKGFCVLHNIFASSFIHFNCICRWETWKCKKVAFDSAWFAQNFLKEILLPPLTCVVSSKCSKCSKCFSQWRENRGCDLGWKGKGQWDPALHLGSGPSHGNGTLTGCCALVVLGGPCKIHHLCPLLPQPEPTWGDFVVFSGRSLSISRVGKCSSPEIVLSFMCCACQPTLFAGRETLASMRGEVIKDLKHS